MTEESGDGDVRPSHERRSRPNEPPSTGRRSDHRVKLTLTFGLAARRALFFGGDWRGRGGPGRVEPAGRERAPAGSSRSRSPGHPPMNDVSASPPAPLPRRSRSVHRGRCRLHLGCASSCSNTRHTAVRIDAAVSARRDGGGLRRLRCRRRLELEDSPTTPARRRRSCSCANSARRCAPAPDHPPHCSPCSASSRRCFRRRPGAPRRARRSSNSRRRSRSALSPPRRRDHAGDLVLEPSAGTGLLAIFAELAGASPDPQRTRRHPRRSARRPLFPASPRHPLRCGAHPRSSRCRRCGRPSC